MAPPKRIYVVAYDYAQFRQWCWVNEFNPRDPSVYYVRDYTSLYGLGYNVFEITYLPDWKKRKDAVQIALTIDALKRANGTKKPNGARKGKRRMEESGLFTWTFWKRTIERMVRAFAGSLIGVMTMDGFNLITASWGGIFAAAGTASLVTLLLSLVGSQVGSSKDPSLVN
jgi:hypothetical protein